MSLETIILSVGYPLVFLFIMGESMGVPMPGETAVLIAAAAAGGGKHFNIWFVFVLAAAGAITGDTIGYWIGRKGGRKVFDRLIQKKWVKKNHLEKAETFFSRHGGKAVFFGRSFSYLRVLTALMAGVSHMHYPRFLFYNALGGVVWAAVVSYIGYTFGQHLDFVEKAIRQFGRGLLAVVAIAVVFYFIALRLGWTKVLASKFSNRK